MVIEYEDYLNIVRTDYCAYVQHVHEGRWIPSKFHKFLCDTVQSFIEEDTGHAYDILCISTPPQHGKLLADDTPVLTKNGWKKHGELIVGDEVINHKGEFVKVTHVFPKGYANREVTFSNGQKILCHENHEWLVYDRATHKKRVFETKYMENRLSYGEQTRKRGHRYNFMLPIKNFVKGENKALKVNPYVLGAWLGDGTNTKPCICGAKSDIVVLDECAKFYDKASVNVHKDTGVITYYYKNLNFDLREYGMCYYQHREDKYIPDDYLTASIDQRLELLAGLLDTDGSLDRPHNRYVFTTADEKLKETFVHLIATFGWHVSVSEMKPIMSSSGIQGKKTYWQLAFNPTVHIPCRIERKQLHTFSKQRKESFREMRPIEPIQGNCISVEGGIYLVGETLIPTHNSETITQTLPSWYLGRNPYKKVIEISYNDDFAEAFGRANKFKIQDFCNELFGIKLARFPNSSKNFKLDNNVGGMLSGGVTSGITGNGANLMIIDDPIKTRQEAYSETTRNSLFGEWCTSYKTRLASGAKVIVIMTRWHEDDLVGRLIETEENIRYVNIPCEAEENDPLGREVGEALCSEIGKGDSWLADFKKAYVTQEGTMTWNAMFQGHPSSMEGNIFRREWWQFYDTLPEVTDWLMSADCTFKDKEDNDFVSIQVWAKLGANMYLVDRVKKHLNLPDTMREIIRLRSTYPMCKTTLIEDKANGSAIIDILRRSMTGIIAVQPKGGKVARANAIVGAVESGNVFLPRKSFTADFIDELASFPNGKHDDDVDACSQALTRLIYNKSGLKEAKSIDFIKSAFPEYNKKGKTAFGRGSKINVI